MSATEHLADSAMTHGKPVPDGAGQAPTATGDEAARARAYLDLWERHLVHVAVRGRLGLPGRDTVPPTG